MSQTGETTLALTAPWILDSGASHHMTSLSKSFKNYIPTSSCQHIRTADGSLSPIAGRGPIQLPNTINLTDVLHVPRLSCNLLSIHKLCKDNNCHADFYPSHCMLQEMGSRRKIGSAKQVNGLYLLDDLNLKDGGFQGVGNKASPAVDSLMLWHCRLGHPSLDYLKRLFPSLVSSNLQPFKCEHCILSKSHKTVYPSRPYKASKPF